MTTVGALSLPAAATASERRFGLDAARAAAIVLVLVAHGAQFWMPYVQGLSVDIDRIAFLTGVYGVEIFFCLSGFLIGGLLLDIQRRGGAAKAVKIFLIRRWIRTLPLYYLTFFVFLVPQIEPSARERLWSYLPLVQNLFTPMPIGNWFGTSWSLAVEEWSYLILPFLAFYICRSTRNPVFFAALILVCFGVGTRFLVGVSVDNWSAPDWDLYIRKIVITRSDAVAYGVMAAVFVDGCRHSRASWLTWLGAILTILSVWIIYAAKTFGAFEWFIFFPTTGIGFALLMPMFAEVLTPPPILAWPVQFFARISYSLYLVHWAVIFYASSVPTALQLVTFYGGSVIVAAALSYLVEYPIMRLRPKQRSNSVTKRGVE
jgi:peptidoglycan/LPS O-acetylase OafA/YrhL